MDVDSLTQENLGQNMEVAKGCVEDRGIGYLKNENVLLLVGGVRVDLSEYFLSRNKKVTKN